MSASRNRLILGLVAGVAAIAAFWFLVLSPKQQEAADLGERIDATRAEVAGIQQKTAQLEAAKGTHDVDYASVVRLGKAVPTDDDVGSLVMQLDSAAKRSGIDFRSVQLSGGAGTTTPPPAAAGAGTAQATTAKLPPGATVGPAGFPTMPFTFEFTGQFFTLSNFFSRLERLVRVDGERIDVSGRLLTVDAFSLKAGSDGFPSVVATIGATAYLIPREESMPLAAAAPAAAGAAPAGAGPATTPVTATTTGAIR